MTDVIDKLVEREEQIAALQQAARQAMKSSAEEIARIVEKGRDCADCGKPIPKARLQVLPFARCCIDCQMAREQGR